MLYKHKSFDSFDSLNLFNLSSNNSFMGEYSQNFMYSSPFSMNTSNYLSYSLPNISKWNIKDDKIKENLFSNYSTPLIIKNDEY